MLLLFSSGGLSTVAAFDSRASSLRGVSSSDALVQSRRKRRRTTSRSPEQLIAWVDSHQAVAADPSKLPPDQLFTLGQWINADTFKKEIHELCGPHTTRMVGTKGNTDMSNAIAAKFRKLGLKTSVETLGNGTAADKYVEGGNPYLGGNVIGFLEGTDLKDETVIVGAHYDSVNWESPGGKGKAPGIDDNGSGSTAVQLVAQAMAKLKPRRSVMFVGFNAEEVGLVGSEALASDVHTGKYGDVKAALIADEVAYPGSGSRDRKAIFETVGTVPGAIPLVDTFAHNALPHQGDGIRGFDVNLNGFSSDHIPFLHRNIPALLLIERMNMAHSDDWGHSERDDYEHVDFDYGAAMTRLLFRAAATLASPANGPQIARNVSLHRIGSF